MSISAPQASVVPSRLDRVRRSMAKHEVDALVVTPGPDLRWLIGYDAVALERLTALVLPLVGEAQIVVPRLEVPAARAADVELNGLRIVAWDEADDPYMLAVAGLDVSRGAAGGRFRLAVDNHMWAEKLMGFARAVPAVEHLLAGPVLRDLRMRKDPAEIEALRQAGAAIDRVHQDIGRWVRVGRTEREVARDIATAILDEGHATVDFVIVASGPNGASPHHGVSDRVLEPGDVVVVDIGGTMPSGYCSDCTRTYSLGEPTAWSEVAPAYEALQRAQEAAVNAVAPGAQAQTIDEAARSVLVEAGLGDLFVHRTGHGIGVETHEEPYLVIGNTEPVDVGMTFSIEPGVYRQSLFGARIEDIVAVTPTGVERLNTVSRDLIRL